MLFQKILFLWILKPSANDSLNPTVSKKKNFNRLFIIFIEILRFNKILATLEKFKLFSKFYQRLP